MEEIMSKSIASQLAGLPSQCLRCQRMGSYRVVNICEPCFQQIPRTENSCRRCGTPTQRPQKICGKCINKAVWIDQTLIACPYSTPLNSWIPALKDNRRLEFAPVLQQLLLEQALGELDTKIDWILPMPIHWSRRLTRGFNQSEILAKPLEQALGSQINKRLLARNRRVRSQRNLNRRQRLRNQRGSFYIPTKEAEKLRDRNILLVEDILTTGATAEQAAKTLKLGQAKTVTLVAVARTPQPNSF